VNCHQLVVKEGKLTWLDAAGNAVSGALDLLLALLQSRLLAVWLEVGGDLVGGILAAATTTLASGPNLKGLLTINVQSVRHVGCGCVWLVKVSGC
jgi:hypothetical protein